MISIAMTTYNGAQFVQAQLRSILEQTRQPDEIIICDDGSRDDTVNIIRHVMETSGTDRIRLVENEENLGYIRNFYKAISLTKGDYIFLADQDDIWHREKLEKSLAIMERTGAAAICTRSRLIDQDGQEMDGNAFIVSVLLTRLKEELGPVRFSDLVIENVAQGCTYCFTKEVRAKYLALNSRQLIHDHQIMFIASLVGKVYACAEPMIDYRIHGSNSAGLQENDKNIKVIWKKPKLKPSRVIFLEELNRVVKVPHVHFYKLLYYLRLPYFLSVWKRRNLSRQLEKALAERGLPNVPRR